MVELFGAGLGWEAHADQASACDSRWGSAQVLGGVLGLSSELLWVLSVASWVVLCAFSGCSQVGLGAPWCAAVVLPLPEAWLWVLWRPLGLSEGPPSVARCANRGLIRHRVSPILSLRDRVPVSYYINNV